MYSTCAHCYPPVLNIFLIFKGGLISFGQPLSSLLYQLVEVGSYCEMDGIVSPSSLLPSSLLLEAVLLELRLVADTQPEAFKKVKIRNNHNKILLFNSLYFITLIFVAVVLFQTSPYQGHYHLHQSPLTSSRPYFLPTRLCSDCWCYPSSSSGAIETEQFTRFTYQH